jgi:hypothetical protein
MGEPLAQTRTVRADQGALRPQVFELLQPVLPAFVVSRSAVFLMALVLQWMLDSGRTIRYAFIGDAPLATLSALFDANWYASIASDWYDFSAGPDEESNLAFMPLFPIAIRVVGSVLGLGGIQGGYNLAGVVVSHICFLFALVLLYKLTLAIWGDERLAVRAVWVLSCLPWAFVFSMAYTESLFLLLILGALYVAYRFRATPTAQVVLAAGILAGLATLTRHTGLFIACCVGWMAAIGPARLTFSERVRNGVLALGPALVAFAGFVAYIDAHTGRLLTVVNAHEAWGRGYLNDLPRVFVLPPANSAWVMDFMGALGMMTWVVLSVWAVILLVRSSSSLLKPQDGVEGRWPAWWAFLGYMVISVMLLLVANIANQSWGRYMMVVFPCVWPLAWWISRPSSVRIAMFAGLALQLLYFGSAVVAQVTP